MQGKKEKIQMYLKISSLKEKKKRENNEKQNVKPRL